MRNRSMIWKASRRACRNGNRRCLRRIAAGAQHHLDLHPKRQSQADADGVIDTEVPGPGLTAEGKGQAQQVVHQAGHKKFDGIYASAMAEAQQTAAPLASELGKQVEVLNGLQSINAGWYNGKPETMAGSTYLLAPADWINGDLQNSIPGSVSGKQFNEQFTAAIQKIYNSGHNNPVVFSQGMAI